jgi:hypothetical protein
VARTVGEINPAALREAMQILTCRLLYVVQRVEIALEYLDCTAGQEEGTNRDVSLDLDR